MSKKEESAAASRRTFLKLAAVSAPTAVAVTALGSTAASAVEVEQTGSGLRDTAHTAAYYESLTF